MTSLLLQAFPVALQSKASPLMSSISSPESVPMPRLSTAAHCCPSRDLVALAGTWFCFSLCGESLLQLRAPRLILSSGWINQYEHGSMRGINIDKPSNTKAKSFWRPIPKAANAVFQDGNSTERLEVKVPSQSIRVGRVQIGEHGAGSLELSVLSPTCRPLRRHMLSYLLPCRLVLPLPQSATSAGPVEVRIYLMRRM